MWTYLLKLLSRIKVWVLKRMEMSLVKKLQTTFLHHHKKLTDDEVEFERLITDYATGGKTKIADIDKVYSSMKKTLREVRLLALEYKEQSDESSKESSDKSS